MVAPKSQNPKNVALLMLAHIVDDAFERRLRKLNDANFIIVIHFDKKSDVNIPHLQRQFPNIPMFSEFPIYWGGYNMLKAMLFLLAEGLKTDAQVFQFISGADTFSGKNYLIINPKHRRARQIIKIEPFETQIQFRRRFGKWNLDSKIFNQQLDRSFVTNFLISSFNTLRSLVQRNPVPQFNRMIKGSQWVTIDRSDANICIAAFEDMEIGSFYSKFPVPDEWFFDTILDQYEPNKYEYDYIPDEVPDHEFGNHLINWVDGWKHPAPIGHEHFKETKTVFGRKIEFDQNLEIFLKRINLFINPYSYLRIRKELNLTDPEFRIYYDSWILYRLARLISHHRGKHASFDFSSLARPLLEFFYRRGERVLFYGGSSSEITTFARFISHTYPSLNVTYMDGYDNTLEDVETRVNEQKVTVVVCGIGSPDQEKTIFYLCKKYSISGYTCGGFISQTAAALNKKSRAEYYPFFVVALNIRWLYRLFKEPHTRKRLLLFYPIGLILFFWEKISNEKKNFFT